MEREVIHTLETIFPVVKEWRGNEVEYSFSGEGDKGWKRGPLQVVTLSQSRWLLMSVGTTFNDRPWTTNIDIPPGSRVEVSGSTITFIKTAVEREGIVRIRLAQPVEN